MSFLSNRDFPCAFDATLDALIRWALFGVRRQCSVHFVATTLRNRNSIAETNRSDLEHTVDVFDIPFHIRREIFSGLDLPHVQCGSEGAEQSAGNSSNHVIESGRIFGARDLSTVLSLVELLDATMNTKVKRFCESFNVCGSVWTFVFRDLDSTCVGDGHDGLLSEVKFDRHSQYFSATVKHGGWEHRSSLGYDDGCLANRFNTSPSSEGDFDLECDTMELNSRVTELERENRRIKRIGLASFLVAGLMISIGQARPEQAKVIQATKFVLVEKNGKQRATLAIENGGPALVLEDTSGRGVVRLQVPKIPDKPSLYLRDPRLSAGLELAMTMNGPVLHLTDRTGTRVRLAANELNAPLAAIYDAEGNRLFRVSTKNP